MRFRSRAGRVSLGNDVRGENNARPTPTVGHARSLNSRPARRSHGERPRGVIGPSAARTSFHHVRRTTGLRLVGSEYVVGPSSIGDSAAIGLPVGRAFRVSALLIRVTRNRDPGGRYAETEVREITIAFVQARLSGGFGKFR